MNQLVNEFEDSKNIGRYFEGKKSVENEIDKHDRIEANVKQNEAALESIPQLVLMLSLASFYWFSYNNSGRRYPYFFGVAKTLLTNNVNNNYIFIGGFVITLLTSSWKFVVHTNLIRHRSLDFKRKLCLFLHYLLSLLTRIGSIMCSLTLPVIMNSDYMQTFVSSIDFTEIKDKWL